MTNNQDETAYESPSITVIGTLHELTLQEKFAGSADGVVLTGQGAIGNISP